MCVCIYLKHLDFAFQLKGSNIEQQSIEKAQFLTLGLKAMKLQKENKNILLSVLNVKKIIVSPSITAQ